MLDKGHTRILNMPRLHKVLKKMLYHRCLTGFRICLYFLTKFSGKDCFKVGLSPSKKIKHFICFNDSPSKMMKNASYFILKALSSISRFLTFCLYFLGMQKKRLDQKDKVNFKIYDVTTWLTKNYNTHIAQYLTK